MRESVKREIIRGPCLYMPHVASEWQHTFSWHGSDGRDSAGDILRKRPNALKFSKLQITPAQTYFDIENVRTSDDALLVIRLMIFYSIKDVEKMLETTKDPVADMINSVSSDVIEFTSSLTFERFKESADKLNGLGTYKNLTKRAEAMGYEVSKVVFRGFIAPGRLQKMHDDAIEKRTRLVLEGESEVQEQKLKDERLEREQIRDQRKHAMQKADAEHSAKLRRNRFEAEQLEEREKKEQQTALARALKEQDMVLMQDRCRQELEHLKALKGSLELGPDSMGTILLAREQGAPEKLVQICGDTKAKIQLQG